MSNQFNEQKYNDAQTALLELVSYFPAPCSVVGSSLILWSIWNSRKKPLRSVYHRFMLAISLLDFLSSLAAIVLGPWVVPEEVQFTRFGRGTFQTCEAAGFFVNFLFGTMWYSCFLSIYFLLQVRFGWREATIALTLEPVAHSLGLMFPLVTGLHGIADDFINPLRGLPGTCWFSDYPPYCTSEDELDCIRGESYWEGYSYFGTATLLSLLLAIAISMVLIVLKVRATEREMIRESVRDGNDEDEDLTLTKETAWQGVLYIGSFFAVYFPILMLFALDNKQDKNLGASFTFALLTKTVTPLQGCFNAYIYLRKRFWKLTREGECFCFIRKIPFCGSWILELDDRNSSVIQHTRNSSTLNSTRR